MSTPTAPPATTTISQGFRQTGRFAEMDIRCSYPTVEAALETGWIEGSVKIKDRLGVLNRHEGLHVYIISEGIYYTFKDGIGDENFTPVNVSFIPYSSYAALLAQTTAHKIGFTLVVNDETQNDTTCVYEAKNKIIATNGDFIHTANIPVDPIDATDILAFAGFDMETSDITVKAKMSWENWLHFTSEYPYTYTDIIDADTPSEKVAHWVFYVTGTVMTIECYTPISSIGDILWTRDGNSLINTWDPEQPDTSTNTNSNKSETIWVHTAKTKASTSDAAPTWILM